MKQEAVRGKVDFQGRRWTIHQEVHLFSVAKPLQRSEHIRNLRNNGESVMKDSIILRLWNAVNTRNSCWGSWTKWHYLTINCFFLICHLTIALISGDWHYLTCTIISAGLGRSWKSVNLHLGQSRHSRQLRLKLPCGISSFPNHWFTLVVIFQNKKRNK